MQYLVSEKESAAYYFGLEQYLAQKYRSSQSILLLWRCPATVMCGRYQNVLAEVNLQALDDVSLVRRKSGGGTIYTDLGTLQFSVIEPLPNTKDRVVLEPYIRPVVEFLQSRGLPVALSGRNDILLADCKVSGHAQYQESGYLVHHGSILLSTDMEKLSQLLTPNKLKLQAKGIQSVRSRVCNIADFVGEPEANYYRNFHDFVRDFIAFWHNYHKETLKIEPMQLKLNADDLKQINAMSQNYLINTRNTADWNRDPTASIEFNCRLSIGNAQLIVEQANNQILSIDLYGDFLSDIDNLKFSALLSGIDSKEVLDLRLDQQTFLNKSDTEIIRKLLLKLFR